VGCREENTKRRLWLRIVWTECLAKGIGFKADAARSRDVECGPDASRAERNCQWPKSLFTRRQEAATAASPPGGELFFEFHVAATHRFYRCEFRDHGKYGVEAQFLDPIDLVISHRWPNRELAIEWAKTTRADLEGDFED